MRAAVGAFLDRRSRIALFGVDHEIGPDLLSQRELSVVDVHSANLQAHDLGVLNGKVSEAARARDDNPLARPRFGFFESLVDAVDGSSTGT
jgi:hypothetical protein